MKRCTLLIVLALSVAMCFSLTIITDSGQQIDGSISGKRNDRYIITTDYGIVLVPIDQVSAIWEDGQIDRTYEYQRKVDFGSGVDDLVFIYKDPPVNEMKMSDYERAMLKQATLLNDNTRRVSSTMWKVFLTGAGVSTGIFLLTLIAQ